TEPEIALMVLVDRVNDRGGQAVLDAVRTGIPDGRRNGIGRRDGRVEEGEADQSHRDDECAPADAMGHLLLLAGWGLRRNALFHSLAAGNRQAVAGLVDSRLRVRSQLYQQGRGGRIDDHESGSKVPLARGDVPRTLLVDVLHVDGGAAGDEQ